MVVLSNCNDSLRSGSYFGKVPVPAPFPVLAQFPVLAPLHGSGTVTRFWRRFWIRLWFQYLIQTYLAQFFNNKKFVQNLAFRCKKQHFFQKGVHYFKFFDFCITFYIGSGSKSSSGSAKAKSCGFLGSDSGSVSTTLPNGYRYLV
jgi:hypothetical protein